MLGRSQQEDRRPPRGAPRPCDDAEGDHAAGSGDADQGCGEGAGREAGDAQKGGGSARQLGVLDERERGGGRRKIATPAARRNSDTITTTVA